MGGTVPGWPGFKRQWAHFKPDASIGIGEAVLAIVGGGSAAVIARLLGLSELGSAVVGGLVTGGGVLARSAFRAPVLAVLEDLGRVTQERDNLAANARRWEERAAGCYKMLHGYVTELGEMLSRAVFNEFDVAALESAYSGVQGRLDTDAKKWLPPHHWETLVGREAAPGRYFSHQYDEYHGVILAECAALREHLLYLMSLHAPPDNPQRE